MPQIALNPQGGSATQVSCRLADPDADRLTLLASQLGVKQGTAARLAMAAGLRQLESEHTVPAHDGDEDPDHDDDDTAQKHGGPAANRTPVVPSRKDQALCPCPNSGSPPG